MRPHGARWGRSLTLLPEERREWECPECIKIFDRPEKLGPHIERHRPIGKRRVTRRGIVMTQPCPRRCGRHFVIRSFGHMGLQSERLAYDQHVSLCDGSKPLNTVVCRG